MKKEIETKEEFNLTDIIKKQIKENKKKEVKVVTVNPNVTNPYEEEFVNEVEKQGKKYLEDLMPILATALHKQNFQQTVDIIVEAYVVLAYSLGLKETLIPVSSQDINNIKSSFDDLILNELEKGLPTYDNSYILESYSEWAELLENI